MKGKEKVYHWYPRLNLRLLRLTMLTIVLYIFFFWKLSQKINPVIVLLLLVQTTVNIMCGSRKYPYPPTEGICPMTPSPTHPSRNSNLASYIALNFWLFQTPPPPRNFQSLLWGEYGYFLEPYNYLQYNYKFVRKSIIILLQSKLS